MDMEYLNAGFDPNSLKVAQLRRILTENNIEFLPQSKKATLVQMFEQNVKPNISKLRKKYENMLPSDQDIVKVKRSSKKKKEKRKDRKKKSLKVKDEEVDNTATPSLSSSADFDEAGETDNNPDEKLAIIETPKEVTPFTEINDFQQESGHRRSSRKRKASDKEKEDSEKEVKQTAEDDVVVGMSSETSSASATPNKSKDNNRVATRKRRRKIGEGEHTPITEKVAKKTPQKSPHRSLVIDKFETSSSDSSLNNSPLLNVTNNSKNKSLSESLGGASPSGSDFSYKRRTISPDITKLNVSAAFAEQLKNAVKENSVPALSQSEQENFPKSSGINRMKTLSSTEDETHTPAATMLTLSGDESISSQETIKSMAVEKDSSVDPEILSTYEVDDEDEVNRGRTPDVLTDQGMTDTESRVNKVHEEVENEHEPVEAVEDVGVSRRTILKSFMKSFSGFLYRFVVFSLIMIPILYGLWYREQRILVGYCGHEMPTQEFWTANSSYPSFMTNVNSFLQKNKPVCLPCPDHAICYPLMNIKCRPEYAFERNKWNLFNLLPLSDHCVKDSKRDKLIAEVVKQSLEFLRTKNAQFSCGECDDDSKSGMTEEELYQIFYESRAPWINDEEFDELWVQAVSDLKNEPEITWRQVSIDEMFFKDLSQIKETFVTNNKIKSLQLPTPGSERSRDTNAATETHDLEGQKGYISKADRWKETRILRSTSQKYIGLRCKFEREIYQTYYRFRYMIWTLSIIGIIIKVIEYRLKRYYKQREKIDQLTKSVINKLKMVKEQQEQNQGTTFLSTVQLRDVFLADVTNLKYKNSLWQQVVKKLEHNNTNIKSSLMEIHGEIMKCWEWIGPLDVTSSNNTEEQ